MAQSFIPIAPACRLWPDSHLPRCHNRRRTRGRFDESQSLIFTRCVRFRIRPWAKPVKMASVNRSISRSR